ncbi:MAG: DUF4326 domain-containing protein [Propionibacteriaceae bacterium]|jgi:hypothetical protein|nr:DUF4326 domain-containing protein [Propionibacteriaceae bacterium]
MALTSEQWRAALDDPRVVRRFLGLVRIGLDHDWWAGAMMRSGHGRFWVGCDRDGRDLVVAAHRFAFALAHGADAVVAAEVVMHWCDEALCQRPVHLVAGTRSFNQEQWALRRHDLGSPFRDSRDRLSRASAIRDAVRAGADVQAVIDAGVPEADRSSPTLPGLEVTDSDQLRFSLGEFEFQLRRTKGFEVPPGGRSVVAPTKWANPFRPEGRTPEDNRSAVERFAEWVVARPDLVREAREELAGRPLGCWCPVGWPCHRQVWLRLVN